MSADASGAFALDPRLAGDGPILGDLGLCRVILRDEARLSWLILTPRRPGLVDLDDLSTEDMAVLTGEIRAAAAAARAIGLTEKLNVASLGNMVAQLHIHVVGRRRDDPFWPAPPFGHPVVRYTPDRLENAIALARAAFAAHGSPLSAL